MSTRTRLSPDDTRNLILETAEEQFRRVGYVKTAVADIAAALDMSPANVYRFFSSKAAIRDALCARLLSECDAMASAIANGPGSAAGRLETLVLELHRFNKSRYTSERRLHDMVQTAMEENWAAIEAHMNVILDVFAKIIGDGVESGEFKRVDVRHTALTVKQSMIAVLHPALIAECAHQDLEGQARALVHFALLALKP